MNNKGSIFSMDILLAIIFVILIIAIIINFTTITNEKINSHVAGDNFERLSYEIADNLINNPGNPSDWEYKTIIGDDIVPGLKINSDSSSNIISYRKFYYLSKNYDKLMNNVIFDGNIKSMITISPINSNIAPITIGGTNQDLNNILEIVSVERIISCDYLTQFVVLSINSYDNDYLKENSSEEICLNSINNQNHENSYDCKSMIITKDNLTYNNYYIVFSEDLINTNSYYIINDNEDIETNEIAINSNYKELNNELNSKLRENGENGERGEKVFWIHLKPNTNTNKNLNEGNIAKYGMFIVAIPKNLDIHDYGVNNIEYDYFKTNQVKFTLKTWYDS